MKDKIKELLKQTERAGIEDLIEWMENNGFFDAPCSSKYHLAQPEGLAEHSLNVFRAALDLSKALYAEKITLDFINSMIICSLLHDLGKAGQFGKPAYLPDPDLPFDTTDFILHEGILFDPTISEAERSIVSNVNGEIRIRQATKAGYAIAENGDGINLAFPTSNTRRGRVIKQKSSTLDCQCNVCVYVDGVIRHFTRKELERLQTLPDSYTAAANDKTAKQAIGNGWNMKTISHIFKSIKEEKENDY